MTTAHYMRQWRYGVSEVEFNRLCDDAGFLCMICREPSPRVGKTHTLRVDHDKHTDKVRGVLCDACNLGLGKFEHDPERLQRAAAYLITAANL